MATVEVTAENFNDTVKKALSFRLLGRMVAHKTFGPL